MCTAKAIRLAGRRIGGVHSRCVIIIVIARPNELFSFCLQSPLLWHSIFLLIDGDFFFFLPPAVVVVVAVAAALLNFFAAGRTAEGGVEGRSGVQKT